MLLDFLNVTLSNYISLCGDLRSLVAYQELFARIEFVCQIVIASGGITALYLIERENRWGYMLGLISQPFWLFTTAYNEQWGLFFLCFVYAIIWAQGVRKRFGRKV